MYTATVTQKGQITIPKKLRDSLNIKSYGIVQLELSDDHIKITPTEDILDLAGTLPPKTTKEILKARDQFEKTYRRI